MNDFPCRYLCTAALRTSGNNKNQPTFQTEKCARSAVPGREVRLAGGGEASMPHTTVGIHHPRSMDYFGNWEVDVMSIANAYGNPTESCKCSMYLLKQL